MGSINAMNASLGAALPRSAITRETRRRRANTTGSQQGILDRPASRGSVRSRRSGGSRQSQHSGEGSSQASSDNRSNRRRQAENSVSAEWVVVRHHPRVRSHRGQGGSQHASRESERPSREVSSSQPAAHV